jgi:hypothetical protein
MLSLEKHIKEVAMRFLVFLLPMVMLFSSCDKIPFLASDDIPNEAMILKMASDNIQVMQRIKADFILTNITNKKESYGFPSSCQFGYRVEKGEELLFDSQHGLMCLAVVTSFELDPGESKTFEIDLSNRGNVKPLDPGTYTLKAFLLTGNSDTASTTFDVVQDEFYHTH